MSSCSPTLVSPSSAVVSQLGEGMLQPEHEFVLHRTQTLPPASGRAVNDPSVIASLPEPGVVNIFQIDWQDPALPWALPPRHAPNLAQPRTIRTISAAASGVPNPTLVGSTTLRSLSNKHLRQRDWAWLAWAWLRHLLTRLGFFRATDQWSDRRHRPELRRPVRD